MYIYPSILGPNKAPHLPCVAFEKVDGSNLRWEWQRKRGWEKQGSRHRLFDETDEVLGPAIAIFMSKYAEAIEKVIRDSKAYRNAERVTAFTEFYGQNSFAGQHDQSDPKDLVLFDLHVFKKGILGPTEFLDLVGHLDVARVVYSGPLNATFIQDAKDGKFANRHSANEGVVCKGGSGHGLWMRKVKTASYIERLKGRFGDEWEKFGE